MESHIYSKGSSSGKTAVMVMSAVEQGFDSSTLLNYLWNLTKQGSRRKQLINHDPLLRSIKQIICPTGQCQQLSGKSSCKGRRWFESILTHNYRLLTKTIIVGSIPLPFTMKNLDVNTMYQHDTEISPALRYCQPGLLINLKKFLKLLNKD